MNQTINQPDTLQNAKKINLNRLIILLIPIFIGIFSLLIYNLYRSTDELSISFINESSLEIQELIQNYIDDINRLVLNNPTPGFESSNDILKCKENNKYFMPSMIYSEYVTSVVIASPDGNSFMLHQKGEDWMNRMTFTEGKSKKEIQTFWEGRFSEDKKNTKVIEDSAVYNPCDRPWFIETIKQEPKVVTWSKPYLLQTDHKNGITASTYSIAKNGDTIVTAYDILLQNFNRIIKTVSLTPNSYGFIVMANNLELIGIHDRSTNNNSDSTSNLLLKNIHFIELQPLNKGIDFWSQTKTDEPFQITVNNIHWWIKIQPIFSNDKILFYSIILIPEKDFRSTMNQTLNITTGSFIIILLLLTFIISNFRKINYQNKQLHKKRLRIERQKKYIEQKNIEILDSINYTQTIQESMLPKEEQLDAAFSDHFVLYLPKDIVSGDLYWYQHINDCHMIAAIDCTGHGVPGAVLSMIAYGGLKSAVISDQLKQPHKILKHLNKVVTSYFLNTTKHEINDGMDIAFTTYYPSQSLLQFSGAKNPVFIVRNNQSPLIVNDEVQESVLSNQSQYLYIVNGDKKGIEPTSATHHFKCHSIQIEKNDTIYLFTDGFADQFGGKKGKKLNMKRFKELILKVSANSSMNQQKEDLTNFLYEWKGKEEQVDDILVFAYRI